MASDLRGDRELVALALSGDLQAFEAIVHRYRTAVVATAARHLANPDDAEDVAQEVFLAAYVRLGDLNDPDRLGGWLTTMARFTCSNHRRRRRDTIPYETEALGPDEDAASPLPCPDE